MTRSPAIACAVAIALAALAAAPGPAPPAPVACAAGGADAGFSTWLERLAPGAFDATAHPTLGSLRVAYRLDAKVLLPLWLTSLELFSRPDVGFASASYRDSRPVESERLRAFEFFTTSVPDRARGIDRMGFFREALSLNGQGVDWTAYFGTMTVSREQTLEEAERATREGRAVAYEVTDGYSSASEIAAGLYDVEVERRSTSADDLYAMIRPKLGRRLPRSSRSVKAGAERALPPLAFLGALQVSLREAGASRAGGRQAKVPRVAFVHNGLVRTLVVEGMSLDEATGRAAAPRGFAKNASRVFRLDYRILNPDGKNGQFRLWAELPPDAGRAADARPIPPIAFELTPRAFLRLHFDRTN